MAVTCYASTLIKTVTECILLQGTGGGGGGIRYFANNYVRVISDCTVVTHIRCLITCILPLTGKALFYCVPASWPAARFDGCLASEGHAGCYMACLINQCLLVAAVNGDIIIN